MSCDNWDYVSDNRNYASDYGDYVLCSGKDGIFVY